MAKNRTSPWAEFAEAQRASAEKYGSVCDQIRSSSMALLQEAYEHWLAWNKAMEAESEESANPPHSDWQVAALLVGEQVLDQIKRVAPSEISVLICGETGTGKELVAKTIHDLSKRASGPFVAINCAGLPDPLFESEIFGYEKGAFTGAVATRIGALEKAKGGTLFLDEIGELSQEVQDKLLRILQEREFERIGSNQVIRADVRILAVTNRNVESLIEAKLLRQDLYYRLNSFRIDLLPLRERVQDLPKLIDYFVRFFSTKLNKVVHGFDDRARDALLNYNYPGNIRELENIIEGAVVRTRDRVMGRDHIPQSLHKFGEPNVVTAWKAEKERKERSMIDKALTQTGGIQTQAAKLLGKLSDKLKKYGI